jgi:3-hydroxyacyl-CoA dehydrogenase/enoyl-CoA hydratase/3-hydroxybutyryl-CoA epimerase
LLATNTSSLSVARLQEGREHPGRIAGLHFFNPVHQMPLVEVVRAPATSDETVAALVRWAAALAKAPVVVKDSPGFLVNRILVPYLSEAVLLVSEGMKIGQVDQVMRRFGMPMGPLELLDQIGLDVAAHVARSVEPVFGNRLPPPQAFERMARQGWIGQKRGTGFYLHRGRRKQVNAPAEAVLRADHAEGAASPWAALPPAVRLREAQERMVLSMVNEAAACLDEGLVADAVTLDVAMVLGTGWAPHRGGPMRYAADRGFAVVVKSLRDLAQRYGRRFDPCPGLLRLAG